MQTTITKIIDSLKITQSDKTELRRLIKRPEIENILKADEIDRVNHRQALIAELNVIPDAIAKLKAQAGKEAVHAVKRFELAEKEFYASKENLRVCQLAATNYAGYSESLREMQIKRELTAGADSRIAEFRFEISNLIGRARSKCAYSVGKERNWLGSM